MKKKQAPKLKLTKITVSRLSRRQTDNLKGGISGGHRTCLDTDIDCRTIPPICEIP